MADTSDADIRAAFDVFDLDGNNTLSLIELQAAAFNLNEILTDEEAQAFMKELDTDGDGVISFDEFKGWVQNSSRPRRTDLSGADAKIHMVHAALLTRWGLEQVGSAAVEVDRLRSSAAHIDPATLDPCHICFKLQAGNCPIPAPMSVKLAVAGLSAPVEGVEFRLELQGRDDASPSALDDLGNALRPYTMMLSKGGVAPPTLTTSGGIIELVGTLPGNKKTDLLAQNAHFFKPEQCDVTIGCSQIPSKAQKGDPLAFAVEFNVLIGAEMIGLIKGMLAVADRDLSEKKRKQLNNVVQAAELLNLAELTLRFRDLTDLIAKTSKQALGSSSKIPLEQVSGFADLREFLDTKVKPKLANLPPQFRELYDQVRTVLSGIKSITLSVGSLKISVTMENFDLFACLPELPPAPPAEAAAATPDE